MPTIETIKKDIHSSGYAQKRDAKEREGYTMIFLSIILISIGLIMFFNPDVFWEITESWKSHNSSGPSDFYKFEVKFWGGNVFPRRFSKSDRCAIFINDEGKI